MLPDNLVSLLKLTGVTQVLELGAELLANEGRGYQDHEVRYQHWPVLPSNPQQRFDLVIVHFANLPANPPPVEQIGLIKNQLTSRIWLIVPSHQDDFAQSYLSLGFVSEKTSNSPQFLNYSYNLDSYNKTREWNNSQFWANPDQWQKRF